VAISDHRAHLGQMPPPQIIRVVDLETTGANPSSDGVCEVGWQDVALGDDGRWELYGDGGARLVNPGRPIPPITQAVHHILDEQVAEFEMKFCTPAQSAGKEWICTWKCALRLWPESPSFSNQVLRYWRKPAGIEHERGLPAHRAFPDAYVTAFHLRDMLNAVGVQQLIAWSNEPGLLPRVRYGPDRGKDWQEIGADSLNGFLTDRDIDIRFTAETELARRRGGGEVKRPARQDLLL